MCLRRTHLSGLKIYKGVNEGQPTIVLKAAKLPRVATCDGSNITTRPRQVKENKAKTEDKRRSQGKGYICPVA